MARSQSSQANTAVIRRALATAQKEIERAERTFHQTIRAYASRPVRAAQRSNTTTSRISIPVRSGAGKPAPVSDCDHEGAEQAPERSHYGAPARRPSAV